MLQESITQERNLPSDILVEKEVLIESIKNLEQALGNLETDNAWLQSLLNDQIITFDEEKKTYTPQIQQCVYSLLKHNVSTTKVPLVIEFVLNMMKVKATRLPCKSTVNNLNIQRLSLIQKHLAEEFSNKQNTCILSDEISKFSKIFEGFHAVDSTGRIWVLGLRQMTTKSGQDAMDTLKEILEDIDSISESGSNTSRAILKNIASTMSIGPVCK